MSVEQKDWYCFITIDQNGRKELLGTWHTKVRDIYSLGYAKMLMKKYSYENDVHGNRIFIARIDPNGLEPVFDLPRP